MSPLLETARSYPLETLGLVVIVGLLTWVVQRAILNIYFHPLSKYPGPKLAAASSLWKAFVECILRQSFCHKLEHLHAQYGDVVRVSPNELHFFKPSAYHEIYNSKNRWDKEYNLYHSFGEDRSSFGFLTYKEAKERKDVLNKTFSAQAIRHAEGLVVDKVNELCAILEKDSREGKAVNLGWAFRSLTMDVITSLCFGKSVDAIYEKQFRAPIIVAMDASLPIFVRFKHSEPYKNMIVNCPPKLSKIISPATAGLVDLQQLLKTQIAELVDNPKKLDVLPHKMTIYHQLMTPEAYKSGTVPEAGSLYEESQALMYGGADTSGNAMMVAIFHIVKHRAVRERLRTEINGAWPSLTLTPSLQQFERLPYLTAVVKEALRFSCGVVSGLLRVVPAPGETISGHFVPAGSVVSCGITFVHYNVDVFPQPYEFRPERWLDNPDLDHWLVSFSRGPRSCLGLNLAWMELRLSIAHVVRKFDMEMEPQSPDELRFRDCFLPLWNADNFWAKVTPAANSV